MRDEEDRVQAVAEAILALTYSEIMDIATRLRDMNDDNPRGLGLPSEWAELLASWAEGEISDE